MTSVIGWKWLLNGADKLRYLFASVYLICSLFNLSERKKNSHVWELLWLSPVSMKIKKGEWRWFEHVKYTDDTHWIKHCAVREHTHNRFTALWICPGQPGSAGTRRNIHPLSPIVVISHPLSASSVYYDPWHPPCSIYVPDSFFPQSLSKFSWSGTVLCSKGSSS